MSSHSVHLVQLDSWDPLVPSDDPGVLVAAQKREIANILKSYTGYYDLFSELLQNALDAVERRATEDGKSYLPKIWITINLKANSVSVTDNGTGMNLAQFKQFLKPNLSFKAVASRGSKGVGATYLGYGFNHLEVATRQSPDTVYSGVLLSGREWLDDSAGLVNRPKVEKSGVTHDPFLAIDKGTSMTLRLMGQNIRPKDLQYFGASTADQWMCILRVHTPVGGIYLCEDAAAKVSMYLIVVDQNGAETSTQIEQPHYLYPHEVLGKTADLREYLKDQEVRSAKGHDLAKIPPRFTGLNGLWGQWTGTEILEDSSPIKSALNAAEQQLVKDLGLKIYVFMGFSTDLWDYYNDEVMKLRKGARILRGGLQQATKHMPQGNPITIPLTNNIGFQNITHVVIHFQNAEPDLGRKGFQPEHTLVAEKLSVSAVTAFRKYYGTLLRRNTGAPELLQQMKLSQWIDSQKEHEKKFPLTIKGKGLFMPTEELPITSAPIVEQDVVALFNQMLSSGLVRGIQLLSSSQFNQYDGLYRIRLEPSFEKYIVGEENPLGVPKEQFAGVSETIESPVQVLEYKYSLDALIEEFSNETKDWKDVKLAVVWQMGTKWKGWFDVISYLDDENAHHRQFHGFTHGFTHSFTGGTAFQVVCLEDLIGYLQNRTQEIARQKQLYSEDSAIM
jgi:hypothetical protein